MGVPCKHVWESLGGEGGGLGGEAEYWRRGATGSLEG